MAEFDPLSILGSNFAAKEAKRELEAKTELFQSILKNPNYIAGYELSWSWLTNKTSVVSPTILRLASPVHDGWLIENKEIADLFFSGYSWGGKYWDDKLQDIYPTINLSITTKADYEKYKDYVTEIVTPLKSTQSAVTVNGVAGIYTQPTGGRQYTGKFSAFNEMESYRDGAIVSYSMDLNKLQNISPQDFATLMQDTTRFSQRVDVSSNNGMLGGLLDMASFAASAIFGGPAGVAAWFAVKVGAGDVIANALVNMGVISESDAGIATLIINAAIMYAAASGSTDGGLSTELSVMDTLMAAGVSSSTAFQIVNTLSSAMSSAMFGLLKEAYSAYSIYTQIEQVQEAKKSFEMEQNMAMARFDVWKKQMEKKSEISDREVSQYVDNTYYRMWAGQASHNYGLPGHDGYVPMSVQAPCYGMFNEAIHKEDDLVASIFYSEKYMNMAGGSNYMNRILKG